MYQVTQYPRIAAGKTCQVDIIGGIANAKLAPVLVDAGLYEIEGLVGGNHIGAQAAAHCRGERIQVFVNKLIFDTHFIFHELFVGH